MLPRCPYIIRLVGLGAWGLGSQGLGFGALRVQGLEHSLRAQGFGVEGTGLQA